MLIIETILTILGMSILISITIFFCVGLYYLMKAMIK